MEKNEIDLNEAKRLIRIKTGKEVQPSRYETKLKEAVRGIRIDELKEGVESLKEILGNIKMSSINPVPGLESKSYLFTYKGTFYLVTGESYKVITDGEAKMEMDNNQPEMYYICTESICPMPPAFVSKENVNAVRLKNDVEVINYIKKLTSVLIKIK